MSSREADRSQNDTAQARAARGGLVSGFAFAVSVGLNLAQVPLLLRFWPQETYGLWLSVAALATMLTSLDGGHQAYIGNLLNRFYVEDNRLYQRTFASAVRVATFTSSVQILLVITVFFSGQAANLIGADVSASRDFNLALTIYTVGWISVGSVGSILVRIFLPTGRYVRSTCWLIASRCVQFIALAFAAWLGLDLTNTAVLFAAAVILVNILLFIDLRRLYPEMFPWWQGGDFRHGMGNFARSSLVTGIGLLDYFSLQGVVLLVAGGLGAVFVPLFTTLRTLANTAMQGVGFLLNPIQPDIVRYHVHREPAKLVSVFAFFWFACGLTLNVVLMAGLFLVENIYAAWTQGRLDFDRPLFAWLAASVLARVLGSPFLAYLTSINDLRAQATVALVRAVLVVAGTTLLMPHWRLAGVGAALCLAEIAGTLLSAGWFTSRALKRIGGKIETVSLFWAAAATGASGAALWAFAMDLTTWPWVVALASVVIAVTANIQWRLLSADLRVRVLTLLPIVSVRSMAAMRARSSANHT